MKDETEHPLVRVVANIDTQTGTWMTECFFAKDEVKYEDLEKMFEED